MPYSSVDGNGVVGARPEDLQPNAFSPVATNGIVNQEEFLTVYQRPIPERMDLFARHANYVGFATLLSMMNGAGRMCSQPTTGHYEAPWIIDQVEVGSVVTPAASAGDDAVIALSTNSHYNTGVTVGGNARRGTYPVVGDVVELHDRTQARVTAKNTSVIPHQITLTPLKAADTLAGKITAADKYGILYNIHAEASGLPAGRAPRVMKYTNELAVIKHSFGSTGFELTNSVYHETIAGRPETAGQAIEVKIKADELVRYERSKSNLLLLGQTADNLTDTATEMGFDVPIASSEGFVPFAISGGTIDNYTAGSYDITDYDTVANILLDERSAAQNDVIGWLGPDLFTEIENSFTSTLQQNLIGTVDRIVDGYANYMNTQYHQQVTASATDATLSFGYSAIRKNGFIFHMKRLSEFADIRGVGSSDYSYRNYALWHPISYTKDMLSGSNRATIGYEYKGLGNYSRENIFGSLPGAGVGGSNTPYGAPVTQYDSIRHFLMSHLGFHGAVANAVVVQRP